MRPQTQKAITCNQKTITCNEAPTPKSHYDFSKKKRLHVMGNKPLHVTKKPLHVTKNRLHVMLKPQ